MIRHRVARKRLIVVVAASVLVTPDTSTRRAQAAEADPIAAHPNAAALRTIFAAPPPADFASTGVTRADYLTLIAGNVDFFKSCQDARGAIVDPVSKGERQYSTPAFAAAAGLLVREAGRKDLLEPASRALTHAIDSLLAKQAADNHPDFFIPLIVHARRSLVGLVSAEQQQRWDDALRRLDPEAIYRADLRHMNWNLVSSSGELLRRKDGLVAPERADAQWAYLETCLAGHLSALTPIGLFEDPGAPMAYDAFSRLWLEDAFADDAYAGGKHERTIGDALRVGGVSTLLMLSPTGEWPTGGRSSMHNWTDAEALAICEMNAARWRRDGRDDVAGAFKRAAHLAFRSIARWQRPSGELHIIKNRAEPADRFAYESYSNHSQYNLLPMAMLAIAYARADESIAERPMPSEVGGYVFDARETFHKVFAAAGGYYVEIDTAADDHYDATGLQRVHRADVPGAALSDSAAGDRAYGPKDASKAALAAGIAWREGDAWIALADFAGGEKAKRRVTAAELSVDSTSPARVKFAIDYALAGPGGDGRKVSEHYVVSADGVVQTSTLDGPPAPIRFQFPTLVHDGAADVRVDVAPDAIAVAADGGTTTFRWPASALAALPALVGPRLVTHAGFVRAAVAETKTGQQVTTTITLAK